MLSVRKVSILASSVSGYLPKDSVDSIHLNTVGEEWES